MLYVRFVNNYLSVSLFALAATQEKTIKTATAKTAIIIAPMI